jgi:hypothetical protein
MEEQLINQIAVQQHLAHLDVEPRMVLTLLFGIDCPPDWTESWPATCAAVGRYVGRRFRNRPLSEAAVRYIRDTALDRLRGRLKN